VAREDLRARTLRRQRSSKSPERGGGADSHESIHVSVLASAAVFGVALVELEKAPNWLYWVAVCLSSIGPAALAYVALSLVFVANLLWDGFTNEQSDAERESLTDFDYDGD